MKPSKQSKNPLYALEDGSINYVHKLLFVGGLVPGGRSMESLLDEYKREGPYWPVRNDLLQHLQRCAIALAEMDALIRARARVHPNRKLRKAK